MAQLTRERIEREFDRIKARFERGMSACTWMGVTVSWQRRPKYKGGNCKRGQTWGIWEYEDVLNGKSLTHEEAVNEIMKPFGERKAKVDLTNIKYCAMCGAIAIGEDEQLSWGRLAYVKEIITYQSTGWKYAHHNYVDICLNCCKKIMHSNKKG